MESPINARVRQFVGWMVVRASGRFVEWSVSHNFFKGRELTQCVIGVEEHGCVIHTHAILEHVQYEKCLEFSPRGVAQN